MTDYISRDDFLADKRRVYCENCDRRKGTKNGKTKFVYEIGDAPCRSCGIGDVLDDVEEYPAADVAPVVHGYNKYDERSMFECSVCGWECYDTYCGDGPYHYCPNCGARMDGKRKEDTP